MEIVKIIGRMEDNQEDPRADCHLKASVSIPFFTAANGVLTAERYDSDDEMDRGGIVFKFTIEDPEGSFIPNAKIIKNGIEIHMAGDIESQVLLSAIKALITIS